MTRYFYHIKLLLYRIAILIAIFTISRFVFHLFNAAYFQIESFNDWFRIYFYGLKYDLVIISIFNAPFILIHSFPGNFKEHSLIQRILKIYFIVINGLLVSLNFIDAKYFDFTNKRSSNDLFKLMDTSEDVWQLLPLFIKDYWYLIMIWIILIFIAWKIYPNTKGKRNNNKLSIKNLLIQVFVLIVILSFSLLGSRGSLKLKPLRAINAAEYTTAQNIPLILNTPFTVLKSINKKELEKKNFFNNEVLNNIYNPQKKFSNDSIFREKNIVIIIMESFAKEYIGALNNGHGYTPYLDTIISNSLVFPNAYANGKKSIEAVPSVLLGIPSLIDNPYLTSSYATNNVRSIATILKDKGYHSSFFHGGKNGTMGFDKFVKFAGFDAYYGLNEYQNNNDFDGGWGIYDEPFFKFFADELNGIEKPFISCFFSLSSHHPYSVPDKYRNKFPKGELAIHESIGYSDFALHSFFEYAKQFNWFNNTLFIITADHTAQLITKKYNNSVGNYRIPMIYYSPGDSINGIDSTVTQQIDIVPSVLDYLNYEGEEIMFGRSIWQNDFSYTVNFRNGIYQIIDQNYVLQFDGENVISFRNHRDDFKERNQQSTFEQNNVLEYYKRIEAKEKLEMILKAYIQEYNSRLINNKLIVND
jgi:phosphoglycerol transferase MdoB-like AlkP superfamily enzyme